MSKSWLGEIGNGEKRSGVSNDQLLKGVCEREREKGRDLEECGEG